MLTEKSMNSSIHQETDYCRVHSDAPWSTYWQRRKLSKRKLRQFFGRSAPIDISPKDIEKYGLQALLQSSVPLCYFLLSLLDQYSVENLFFYLEVEQFQMHEFHGDELKKTALQIYRAFLKQNSDFEINIDAVTKKPIREAIERGDHMCFNKAKEHIQGLMEPGYINFLGSSLYKTMMDNLKGMNVPYDSEAREEAMNMLIDHLDKNVPLADPNSTGPINDGQRRNNLIRAMVHAFCQTRLHLDFYDTPSGENVPLSADKILPPPEQDPQQPKIQDNTTEDYSKLIKIK